MGALILTRKVKQVTRFMLGDRCLGTETIYEADGGRARIGYAFSRDVRIVRDEIPITPDAPITREQECEGK